LKTTVPGTAVLGGGMSALEVLLRGVTAGVMLALSIAMLGGGANASATTRAARWSGAVFCLAVAAFAVHSGGAETRALGVVAGLVWLLSVGGIGYFWLFAVTLFDDRRFGPVRLLPVIVLTVIAAIAAALPRPAAAGVWIVYYVLATAMALHVIWVLTQTWGGDLVESRRSLRAPLIALIAAAGVVLSALQLSDALGMPILWEGTAQAAALAVMSLLGAWVLLQARPDQFEPHATAQPIQTEAMPAKDRLLHEQLQALLQNDAVWRREGLTIRQLAAELDTAEHRLRRLINGRLGYRNFADFLNARRIEAAKATLADPAAADVAISTLAFELGYASLGPFNRAFKQATGTTPSAFRSRALAASPDSNIPR
jgi:AraC-like DNA-binding protein